MRIFDTQSLPNLAHVMALLAKAAYLDDCREDLTQCGFDEDYQAINCKDANAHIACDDDHILIAIRGTEVKQLKDLSANARWWPKKHGPGWVHTGFRAHARKILPDIQSYIAQHPGRAIYLTGHSLGGAMALYIAQELEWAGYDGIQLFTYGAPRLGNRSYVKNIKNIQHHRYVNSNDLVPRLPPAIFGYRHHGTRHYINRNGSVTDRYAAWEILRDSIKGRLKSWSMLEAFDGLRDHSMDAYVKHLARAASLM
jgi:triacylglycerol lipase